MRTIAAIYRLILASRYKICLKGKELLKSKSPKLFLPNHQAHVDAQMLTTKLLKYTSFIPMVSARFFDIPVLKGVFKMLKAIPISNIQSGKIDKDIIDKVVTSAIEIIKSGNNVLIYPSGQLAGQGFEKIFNKSSAYNIVKNIPGNTQIIGVRINGLWGSMWSKAWSGDIPPILSNFFIGLFYVLANLIFFVPKRKVSIEFVDITKDSFNSSKLGKLEFNTFLESFYNQKEEEVNFLKHFFYAPKPKRKLPDKIVGSLKEVESTFKINSNDIPQEVLFSVIEEIKKETGFDKKITAESNLALEIGLDSLGLVFLITAIENKFGVTFNTGDFAKIKTVGDLCMIAMGSFGGNEELKPSALALINEKKTRITVDPTKNIRDNFIKIARQNKKASLAYDKTMGSNSRKDLLLKSIVVSKLIKKHVKEEYVGIMLPALESTTLLIMASYFAGKVPVMLNWTVGEKMLLECIKSVGLKKVITATAFYDKVEDQLPHEMKEYCLFFDKEIKKVKLSTKLSSLFNSFFPKMIYGRKKLNETAVILFTSGSETVPKAVPLTHKNIMYNLWGVLQDLVIYNTDILIGFLPPFHSFGFTVISILPMVTGVKAAYTPDPKDAREISKIMEHTKATILLATPTFLNMIMSVASDSDFSTIRLAITGAESLHPTIADRFKSKTGGVAMLIQGYGITECSPILSITSAQTEDLKSVGKFVTGVDSLIIDIDTNKSLKKGQEGMIVVHGKNIFSGYLDKKIESPFIEIDGKQYYKTGDLGYFNKTGDLYITGRLKRFIKIAGEMISLPAIESALLEKFGSGEEQLFAVEGDETGNKPKIVLFSKIKISVDEVNKYLKEMRFSNLMKINKIQEVDEIPLLGSGKTDYKKLKQMTKELSLA